jgi:hypothetical protein
MFNRLNDIVNELKCLDFDVTNKDFSHKFLRRLPEKYETIVTLLVWTDLNKITPTEVLGEVQTHDLFKQSQKEVQGQSMSEEKKNIAIKDKATQEENDDVNQEIDSDEEIALIVKGLKRIMKKKKFGKMGQTLEKNPFEGKDCFNCGEIGHISINCPNNKEDKYGKKKDKKSVPKRKKYYKTEKNGQAYFVEWDSDASSDEDDDDKPSRGLAEVAIKEAPSLFSKPYCLMAKGESKVNYKAGGRHWVIDSGCTNHMTGERKIFSHLDEDISDFENITFGDDSKGGVQGIGEVPISKDYNPSNVFLVDSLNFNLLSIAQLCDNGYKYTFTSNNFEVTSLDGKNSIFKGFRHESLYLVDFSSKNASLTTCLFSKASMGWLWHRRLGHVGMKQLNRLVKHDLVLGFKDVKFEKDKLCSACQARKQVANSHPKKSTISTTRPLELLHMDLFGPTTYRSIGGNIYCFVIVDDYSRYT